MTNSYKQRLSRLAQLMRENNIECLILNPGANMRYLTGFSEEGYERFLALIVTSDEACSFIVPTLNASQAAENLAGISTIHTWNDKDNWQAKLKEATHSLQIGSGNICVDDSMPARFLLPLRQLFPQAEWELAGVLLTELRQSKDAQEKEALKSAGASTDSLIQAIYDQCKDGVTEREIASFIEKSITDQGNEISFPPIVAFGENSANPHHRSGSKKLQAGDIVLLDFGAKYNGYCGDITRTVAYQYSNETTHKVYEIVSRAYRAGLAAVKPGATAEDIDSAARTVIEEAGYGKYFIHRTGHGIGLDDHEPPFIVSGSKDKLLPRKCFSIEPGIYLPGNFGIRLENIIMVDADGFAEELNAPISPVLPIIE